MLNDILYTAKEVSEIIHTSKDYVYQLIKAGLLPGLKLGALKVRKEALLKFLSEYEGMDLTNPKQVSALASRY